MPDSAVMIQRMEALREKLGRDLLIDEDEAMLLLRWVRATAWGDGLVITPDAKSLPMARGLVEKGLMITDGGPHYFKFFMTRAGFDALIEYVHWALVGMEFVPGQAGSDSEVQP